MGIQLFPVTLKSSELIAPKVKHFIFSYALDLDFQFVAGQFVTMHFEQDGKILRRSYSLANSPGQKNRIEFAANFVEGGPASNLLFNLKPGDSIQINGPFGRLILKDDMPKRYILAATSTGVTPYRSMLPEIEQRLDKDPSLQVVLLEGVQLREQLLYKDEFLAFAKSQPRFSFRAQYSRESAEDLKPFEHKGYIQTALTELELNPEQDIVYLCGNPAMIDASYVFLNEQGFPIQHIVREKYISR